MTKFPLLTVSLVLVLLALPIMGGAVGQSQTTTKTSGSPVHITDFSIDGDYILIGQNQSEDVQITVKNQDSVERGISVVLYTANPNNETNAYRIPPVTLDPGEERTITQPLNATTPGTHGLRAIVTDPANQQQYAVSEIITIEVREEPPAELGGPIDRTEIALVALVGAILGILGLGYRQVT